MKLDVFDQRAAWFWRCVLSCLVVICSAESLESAEPGTETNDPPPATAEPIDGSSADDLAKKAQNPVSDLISLPLQNNFDFGVGSKNGVRYTLNIQPVYPAKLNDNWNLINRPIIPLRYEPELAPGVGDVFGLGDIQYQAYLSPRNPSGIIWGAGAALAFPSATDDVLGTGKWTAGPGLVALKISGPWVLGALVNNTWSYAGDSSRSNVSLLFTQPIINYNLPKGWYLNSIPFITSNWEAPSGEQWTVPLGGGIGKVQRIGKIPFNFQLGAYWNAVKPDTGADWQLRFQIQAMFPK